MAVAGQHFLLLSQVRIAARPTVLVGRANQLDERHQFQIVVGVQDFDTSLTDFQILDFQDDRSIDLAFGECNSPTVISRFLNPDIRDPPLWSLNENALFDAGYVTRVKTWLKLISQGGDQTRVDAFPKHRVL